MFNYIAKSKLKSSAFLRAHTRFLSIVRKSPPLYAHPLPNTSLVTLSVSPDPKAVPMGTIPESYTELLKMELSQLDSKLKNFEDPPEKPLSNPGLFIDDPLFLAILHQTLAENVLDCPVIKSLAHAVALMGKTDYFNVYDLRGPPPSGRIPYVEDTLGMVRLDKSGIIKGSYQPNPMYRIVTVSGVLTLSDFLNDKLRIACEEQEQEII